MISNLVTYMFMFAAATGLAIPIVGFLFLGKKVQKDRNRIIVGAIIYILITIIAKDFIDNNFRQMGLYYNLISGVDPDNFLTATPIALYYALINAAFIIVAIFAAYRFIGRREQVSYNSAFSMALGFATIGSIWTLTIPFFSNFLHILTINDGTFMDLMMGRGLSVEQAGAIILFLQAHTIPLILVATLQTGLLFLATIGITLFIFTGLEKDKEAKHAIIGFIYLFLAMLIVGLTGRIGSYILTTIVSIITYAPAIYYLFNIQKLVVEPEPTKGRKQKKWKK